MNIIITEVCYVEWLIFSCKFKPLITINCRVITNYENSSVN